MRHSILLLAVILGTAAISSADDEKKSGETIAGKVVDKMTRMTGFTQGYTKKRTAEYGVKLTNLAKARTDAKAKMAKEEDSAKKQEIAQEFYKKQKACLVEMDEDIKFTNEKINSLYNTFSIAMGGYGKAEGELDKVSQAFNNNKSLINKRTGLKNAAGLLLEKKKTLPKNKDKSIDKTSDEFRKFNDEEDILLEQYEDVEDDIRRSGWKLKYYDAIKTSLSGHRKQAEVWNARLRKVRRKYKSLAQDIDWQLEKVNHMIAAGKMNQGLAEMAGYGKVMGDVDALMKQLSNMGPLGGLTIDPIEGNDDDDDDSLTLEEIVKGKATMPEKKSPDKKDAKKSK